MNASGAIFLVACLTSFGMAVAVIADEPRPRGARSRGRRAGAVG